MAFGWKIRDKKTFSRTHVQKLKNKKYYYLFPNDFKKNRLENKGRDFLDVLVKK